MSDKSACFDRRSPQVIGSRHVTGRRRQGDTSAGRSTSPVSALGRLDAQISSGTEGRTPVSADRLVCDSDVQPRGLSSSSLSRGAPLTPKRAYQPMSKVTPISTAVPPREESDGVVGCLISTSGIPPTPPTVEADLLTVLATYYQGSNSLPKNQAGESPDMYTMQPRRRKYKKKKSRADGTCRLLRGSAYCDFSNCNHSAASTAFRRVNNSFRERILNIQQLRKVQAFRALYPSCDVPSFSSRGRIVAFDPRFFDPKDEQAADIVQEKKRLTDILKQVGWAASAIEESLFTMATFRFCNSHFKSPEEIEALNLPTHRNGRPIVSARCFLTPPEDRQRQESSHLRENPTGRAARASKRAASRPGLSEDAQLSLCSELTTMRSKFHSVRKELQTQDQSLRDEMTQYQLEIELLKKQCQSFQAQIDAANREREKICMRLISLETEVQEGRLAKVTPIPQRFHDEGLRIFPNDEPRQSFLLANFFSLVGMDEEVFFLVRSIMNELFSFQTRWSGGGRGSVLMTADQALIAALLRVRSGLGLEQIAVALSLKSRNIAYALARSCSLVADIFEKISEIVFEDLTNPESALYKEHKWPIFEELGFERIRLVGDGTSTMLKTSAISLCNRLLYCQYYGGNCIRYILYMNCAGYLEDYSVEPYVGSTDEADMMRLDEVIINKCASKPDAQRWGFMFDKGAPRLRPVLDAHGIPFIVPHRKIDGTSSSSAIDNSREISSRRSHIERLIGSLKDNKILTNTLPLTEIERFPDYLRIAVNLTRFKGLLTVRHPKCQAGTD